MRYKKHDCDMCQSDGDRARWVDLVERSEDDFILMEGIRQLNGMSIGLFWCADEYANIYEVHDIKSNFLDNERGKTFCIPRQLFKLIKAPLKLKRFYERKTNAL